MGQITENMGLIRLGYVALFASGILTAPSPLPDKPQAAAGGYGAPATPSCTLQRVEQPSGYGCTQDQECSTSYEQECSTSYEQQCENVYEEKCETEYDDVCETKYDQKCETRYEDKCHTEYAKEC